MSRSSARKGFTSPVRVALLEDDVDHLEGGLEGLRDELKNIRNILLGVLVSVTTASILLALNVLVGK